MSTRSHSVLIPVGHPERVSQYIEMGNRIAKKCGSDLVLLSIEMADVGDPQPVSEEIIGDAPSALQEIGVRAERFDAPVHLRQIRAQNIAEGIVFAAQDADIDYVVMGWRGDEEGEGTVIGEDIDGLVREADAHAIVMQQGPLKRSEHVLIPVLDAKLAPLALAVASLLAEGDSSPVTILYLSPGDLPEADRETLHSSLFSFDETAEGPQSLIGDASFEVVFEATDKPLQLLLDCSGDYDRMILEAGQTKALAEKVRDERSASLPEKTKCPLTLVRSRKTGAKFGL